jgi:DNA polymerase-3 subunit beta
VDDYPQIPSFDDGKNVVSIPQSLLLNMLRMTSFAMSRDEARFVLNGTLFVIDKKDLKLVATDGRRLAMIEKTLEKASPIKKEIIVPTKTIHELIRNLGDEGEVDILFKENQLQFKLNKIVITSRLIEGEFPNYAQVIPQKTKEQITVDTKEFLSAAKRASIFTNQDSQSIKINLDKNRMTISKNSPEIGEAHEEIETDYKGGDFAIGFNPAYLIDVLKNIDEEKIRFELIDPEKPGMIKTKDNYTYIVLPMQLS